MPRRDSVEINGVRFAHVFESHYGSAEYGEVVATTAIHDRDFRRTIGGIRLLAEPWPGNREVAELAKGMTGKAALAGLEAGGQKTTVYFTEGLPERAADRAAAMAEHLRSVLRDYEGATFGPDMNCNEKEMSLLAHEYGLGTHAVGLPRGAGGLSIDRRGFTAHGLVVALEAATQHLGWPMADMTVAVQGFGAVGAHLARRLARRGMGVTAVSCRCGMLHSASGLEIEELLPIWDASDERQAAAFARYAAVHGALFDPEPNRMLSLPADIFVPAARTNALALPEERVELADDGRPDAHDVEAFARATGARVVLEGANRPLSDGAEEFLHQRGVLILPDYLVNCGGLIGCWADHLHREQLEGGESRKVVERIEAAALDRIAATVRANVPEVLDLRWEMGGSTRKAARHLATLRRREILAAVDDADRQGWSSRRAVGA